MNHEQYTDEQIIAALKETFGKVYLAAEKLGCHPSTIYERSEKSPEVAQTLEHYPGRLIDIAETSLTHSVLAGEPWAVRFALRTLGQKRGYTERPPTPPPVPRTTMKDMVQEMIEADELMTAGRQRRAEMTFTLGDPPRSYEELEKAVHSLTRRVGRPRGRRKKSKAGDQPAPSSPPAEPNVPSDLLGGPRIFQIQNPTTASDFEFSAEGVSRSGRSASAAAAVQVAGVARRDFADESSSLNRGPSLETRGNPQGAIRQKLRITP